MQTFIQSWRQVPFKNFISLSIGLSLFVIATILVLKGFLPPEVPLFYGKAVGPEQLTSSFGLVIAPGVSIVLTLINILIASRVSDLFLKKALAISSLFVSFLIAITVMRIILLVGFF